MRRPDSLRISLPILWAILVAVTVSPRPAVAKSECVSFFPLVYRQTEAEPRAASETHALYPFYSESHSTTQSLKGVHPLYSWYVNHERAVTELDALWPLFSWRDQRDPHTGSVSRRVVAPPLWFSSLATRPDQSTRNWQVLFPFYYAGLREDPPKPEKSFEILFPFFWRFDNHYIVFPLYYTDPGESFAVWPVYGQFDRLFSFDSIRFVLWPLWVESHRGDVHSYSPVWPVFNVATGSETGWRLWPLAGYRTGEEIGRRFFWLWPLGNYRTFERGALKGAKLNTFLPFWFFFTHEKREIGYYFPLYGYSRSPRLTTVSWFWPIYSHRVSTDPVYEKTNVLWLLWTRKFGPRILQWEAFPFASQREEYAPDGTTVERVRQSYLWPLIHYRMDHKPEYGYDFVRRYALPFYTARERHYFDDDRIEGAYNLWPLASWGNEKGRRRLSVLNFFPHAAGDGVDRNWAPLWTFWSSFEDEKTGAYGHSLFGPVWRSYRDPSIDRTEVNFLFVRFTRDGDARRLSLLGGFLPFGIGGGDNEASDGETD
ncbi:hypothetical protein JW916_15595 [Candidatus Sumerlaeota bacterium]|nr:hypothetical protein [Candidatus Sumerlaeota bacterium]